MTRQLSYTKFENRVLPNFREKVNKAESTEDLRKFFVYSTKELFDSIFEGEMDFSYEDFVLTPDRDLSYRLSDRLLASEAFMSVWNESDLPRVLSRFAEYAARHYKRLERKPDKCETKIRIS